jgi:hypothetical protein
VLAKSFWAAKKVRDKLVIQWDDTHAEKRSSAQIMDEYRKLAEQPGTRARKTGTLRRHCSLRQRPSARPLSFHTWHTRPWNPSTAWSSSLRSAARSGRATSSRPSIR